MCSICACLKLYNVGTGSCADYSEGQGLQGRPMNIAPCSGTGSQVTMSRDYPLVKSEKRQVTQSDTSPLLFSQHCELNFEGEVRWGPLGAWCLDAETERLVLSPCPIHRPTTSRLQWKFIKARQRTIFLVYLLYLKRFMYSILPCKEFGKLIGSLFCFSSVANLFTNSLNYVWRL